MIFNIFKSKPTLNELIPRGFVDIHSHILPGIDDGAKNTEESLALISKMKEMGFSKIIGTPHTYPGLYENTSESIIESFNLIKSAVKDIDIDYASEYMIDSSIIDKCENKNILPLKENYILIELSFVGKPDFLFELLFKIQIAGFIPILAHPERYLYFNDLKNLIELKKRGCKFQMNLFSCIGYYGKDVLNLTKKILENELYDFAGSDIHNKSHVELFNKKVSLKNYKLLSAVLKNNEFFR